MDKDAEDEWGPATVVARKKFGNLSSYMVIRRNSKDGIKVISDHKCTYVSSKVARMLADISCLVENGGEQYANRR